MTIKIYTLDNAKQCNKVIFESLDMYSVQELSAYRKWVWRVLEWLLRRDKVIFKRQWMKWVLVIKDGNIGIDKLLIDNWKDDKLKYSLNTKNNTLMYNVDWWK